MSHYKFDCGCSFKIAKELNGYAQPRLKFDYYSSFNENCPEVWRMFENGLTLGIFQLESNLGKKYCKLLKPTSISHLSALTAILRPGCLANQDENGLSITEKYCKRKNGLESIEQPIKPLIPILEETYQLLCYQEQQIRMGIEIAGFSQSDADYYLRKAVGTKNAELLFSAEEKFLAGCKQIGKVNETEAKTIFDWIKKAARYSFNKCLSPDSIVRTPIRDKRLGEICIGDKVLSKDGYVTVKNVHNHGLKYMVHAIIGWTDIKCTIDHKFKTYNGVLPLWQIFAEQLPIEGLDGELHYVRSITSIGTANLMDIEVDSVDHLFYANELLTSNSHSVAYGIHACHDMFLKVHDPLSFYTAKLRSPRAFTSDDATNLIYEAKLLNIQTKLPDMRHLRAEFYNDGQSIYFGLANIRDFGQSSYKELCAVWKDYKDELTGNFFDFAVNAALLLSPSIVKLLIQSGAVDFFGYSRAEMLAEFELVSGLTKGELEYLGKLYHAKKAGIRVDKEKM